jgi:sec-independent protein translocase protein TatB
MFDIGLPEMLVVGVVALIVVGPKDLPKLFRTLGQFTGKAKAMAREFSSAMNAAADGAGVGDLKKMGDDIRSATSTKNMGLDGLNNLTKDYKDWEPGQNTAALSKERQEQVAKIKALSAQKAQERLDREAAAKAGEGSPAKAKAAATDAPADVAPAKAAPKKAPAKKAPAKKPAAKTAASKPAAAAKKPAAKKPAAKKPAPKKAASE